MIRLLLRLMIPLLALGASPLAHGDPLIWISGVGYDPNPGSRTAPCQTFVGAFQLADQGGEIMALDPGAFGALTIDKAITIDGGRNTSGVLASGTNGIRVAAGPGDVVVLRNLEFNGSGGAGLAGVSFQSGARLVLEHCTITGFGLAGVEVLLAGGGQLVLRDVHIKNCPTGVKLSSGATASASLDRVSIQGAATGIDVLAGTLQVTRSSIAFCTGAAVLAEGGTVTVQDCLLTANGVAANASSGTLRLSRVDVYDNAVGFQTGAGTLVSAHNNRTAGNGAGSAPTAAMTVQ